MFYKDRLYDDYEIHQRQHDTKKGELDLLLADATIKRTSWYNGLLSRLGDGLIGVGRSIKEKNEDIKPTALSSLTR